MSLLPRIAPTVATMALLSSPLRASELVQPAPLDAHALDAIQEVYTDPGELPQLKVEGEGRQLDLPLKHTRVKGEITGYVAQVEVAQTYHNPFTHPIEAVYVFPLPENSAVNDMKMIIGKRVIEAEIQKRDDARRTYEEAKQQGHTAALLEQERPNLFTQSVANIEPGADIQVWIRYVQDLTYDDGHYEFVFPMVVGPRFNPGRAAGTRAGTGWGIDTDEVKDASRITPAVLGGGMRSGHDISLELVATAGLPIAEWDVPTHDVEELPTYDGSLALRLAEHDSLPNRDFILRYHVDGPEPQAAVLAHRGPLGGYLTLIVQPPQLDIDQLVGKRELIFVADVSGSMWGVPIAMCQEAMEEAIRLMRPVDTFNVITFAGSTGQAFASSRPANQANIGEALKFVRAMAAGGGTTMIDGVAAALDPDLPEGRHRYVFFLTDGYVGNEDKILAATARLIERHAHSGQRAKVFAFGVGSSVNRYLIDGLGKAGGGVSFYASTREDPLLAVNRFYRVIDHPVLRDVSIDWGGLSVEEPFPTRLPDLFATRPLIVQARYKGRGTGTAVVRGSADGKRIELPVQITLPEAEADHVALPALWARAKIGWLERDLWDAGAPQAAEAITALGLKYGLVTRFTSLVAVDRSQKVSDGKPRLVAQPVEAPEGVDPVMAGGGIGTSRGFAGIGTAGRLGGGGMAYGSRVDLGKPKASRHAIMLSTPVVMGALPKELIQKVINDNKNQIRHCYELELQRHPTLSGKVVVKWTISEAGLVAGVIITESTLNNTQVEQCIISKIKAWKFSSPAGGGTVEVNYPFVFRVGA